jgi:hypothetical protein
MVRRFVVLLILVGIVVVLVALSRHTGRGRGMATSTAGGPLTAANLAEVTGSRLPDIENFSVTDRAGRSFRDGIASPEAFLLRLADRFTGEFGWVSGGRWAAEEDGWSPDQRPLPLLLPQRSRDSHGGARRDNGTDTVISGFHGLTVMKTTQSGFVGFPRTSTRPWRRPRTGFSRPTSQPGGATTRPIWLRRHLRQHQEHHHGEVL